MENNHRKYLINDFQKLKLRIFTIGYPLEGESIIGVIDDEDRHLFSFVIDSYEIVDPNKRVFNETLEKLRELNISSIDAFFWTHPDIDHSKGIQTLLSEADKEVNAFIFLPAMLNKDLDLTDEARNSMDYLFGKYNKGRKYQMSMVVKNQYETNRTLKLTFEERRSGREMTGEFYFLAPNGARLLRGTCANKGFGLNRLSIMFSLRMNHFDYLFCGDLMGDDVQFLDGDFLKNVRFIKIPHHGSTRTRQLPELLDNQQVSDAIAATTVFAKCNLPEEETIQKYKSVCTDVYSTSEGPAMYGCVETCFNIRDLSYDAALTGNAKVCI